MVDSVILWTSRRKGERDIASEDACRSKLPRRS